MFVSQQSSDITQLDSNHISVVSQQETLYNQSLSQRNRYTKHLYSTMAAPHPQMPGFQSARLHKVPNVQRVAAGPVARMLPTLVVVGSVGAVLTYVASQLSTSKSSYDRIFAQQNTPEVEAARRKQLQVDTMGDPRRTLFNVLGW